MYKANKKDYFHTYEKEDHKGYTMEYNKITGLYDYEKKKNIIEKLYKKLFKLWR